jgi:hypothetical protein
MLSDATNENSIINDIKIIKFFLIVTIGKLLLLYFEF